MGKKVQESATRAAPKQALEHYHRLINLLADRVRSVAKGFQTGAYIVGRPGTGKTHTVRRVLDELEVDYVIRNGRITPAALFDAIEEKPEAVLVIDDVIELFSNPLSAQILQASIGGNPGTPRTVTYLTKSIRRIVDFRGGVIAISNRPLAHDKHGAALASRMAILTHEPSDEMLRAFMEATAKQGLNGVSAKDCFKVLCHVVDVCRSAERRIDLRHFFNGVEDYRCWKTRICDTHWKALVESAIRSVAADQLPPSPQTRAETKSEEHDIVRDLHNRNLPKEELKNAWYERTGKSMDSYYRRRRELGLR